MSKKNARSAQPTSDVVESPSNDVKSIDLASLDDDGLHSLLRLCLDEVKARKEAFTAALPQVGERVRITGNKKWADKEGVIVARAKTKCHVAVDGFPVPAYVAMQDVTAIG